MKRLRRLQQGSGAGGQGLGGRGWGLVMRRSANAKQEQQMASPSFFSALTRSEHGLETVEWLALGALMLMLIAMVYEVFNGNGRLRGAVTATVTHYAVTFGRDIVVAGPPVSSVPGSPPIARQADVPLLDVVLPGVEQEPINHEPVTQEDIYPPPVEQKPINPEPVNPEPINPEPVVKEPVNPEPVVKEPVEQRPNNPPPVTQDSVEQKPVDQRNVDQLPIEQLPFRALFIPEYNTYVLFTPASAERILVRPAPATRVIVRPETVEMTIIDAEQRRAAILDLTRGRADMVDLTTNVRTPASLATLQEYGLIEVVVEPIQVERANVQPLLVELVLSIPRLVSG